jgi:ribosomal protein S18 acetylase RimI-like enzyme
VWYGFDSGEPAPESFAVFSREMSLTAGIALFAVRSELMAGSRREIASTGMLAAVGGTAGIYYVSTRPGYRNRGLARSVMKASMSSARAMGYDKISLLATSSGYPMYLRCGFKPAERVRTGIFEGVRRRPSQ